MGIYLNPGNDLFEMSVNSEIYIDKTMMIEITNSVLRTDERHICISRPRRFGKSMAANMLTAYYSRGCDSEEMFAELAIRQSENFQKHLNKYDVIYLDVTVRKRGYYSLRFEKIEPTGKEYDVTRKYMQMMETTISRAPEYWLWTHKRWKRTRKTWEKVMHERNQDSRIELAKTEDKNRLRK